PSPWDTASAYTSSTVLRSTVGTGWIVCVDAGAEARATRTASSLEMRRYVVASRFSGSGPEAAVMAPLLMSTPAPYRWPIQLMRNTTPPSGSWNAREYPTSTCPFACWTVTSLRQDGTRL